MPSKFPYHIAIILDGNRRYAKKKNLNPWKGHEFGAEKVKDLIDWALELGIKQLTLYTFSIENFNRNKQEVDYLMGLFRKNFRELKKSERIKKDKVRLNFIGKLNLFPHNIQKMMHELMEDTKNYDMLKINFAIGYGGRAEIIDAAKKIITDIKNKKINPESINEESFSNYLYLKDEPDLILRPGGEIRVSNFLIYQGAYSEWIFMEKLWPEITKADIKNAIKEFHNRERRFGK